MRRTLPAVLVVVAACAAATTASGSGAHASQAVFLRETGCRDIVDGAARYERDRLVQGLPVADSDYPAALKADSGRLVVSMGLAAPSCSRVDYVLRAYRPDGSQLLERVVTRTAHQERVEFDVHVSDHDDDCLAVQLATRVGGTVVDLAPDALESFDTVCDREVAELLYR